MSHYVQSSLVRVLVSLTYVQRVLLHQISYVLLVGWEIQGKLNWAKVIDLSLFSGTMKCASWQHWWR